jgi:hypothetical protein
MAHHHQPRQHQHQHSTFLPSTLHAAAAGAHLRRVLIPLRTSYQLIR